MTKIDISKELLSVGAAGPTSRTYAVTGPTSVLDNKSIISVELVASICIS